LRIPIGAITSGSTGTRQGTRARGTDSGWEGTSIPFTDIRPGWFRRQGLRAFLSFGSTL
jgi:hypothetical protein